MNSYLLRFTPPAEHDYDNLVQVDGDVYLFAGDVAPAGARVIGEWAFDGTLISVDLAAYKAIRPLGNVDGQATGVLAFQGWAGHGLRNLSVDALYPPDESPFAIEVRHREFTGEANPDWNGWGWRAEIVGDAGSRDPSARAIGVYHDEDCTDSWYTTGAFTSGPSEWQVDEVGAPLTVWFTQYNPAYLGVDTSVKQDHHHAVLLGAAQEGHSTLYANAQSASHLYWQYDQGHVPPPDADWVDTGATVTQLVGAGVYRVSLSFSGVLTPGQAIRLGSAETTFTGFWSDFGDYLLISPHVTAPVGAVVWVWE